MVSFMKGHPLPKFGANIEKRSISCDISNGMFSNSLNTNLSLFFRFHSSSPPLPHKLGSNPENIEYIEQYIEWYVF